MSAAPSVTLGNNLTYMITVTNNGPDTPDIALTSVLQPNVALVSIPPGCVGGVGGTITCGPLSLASGASIQLTIVIRALVTPTITNTVTVTSPTIQDPNPANNTATITTTVASGGADLGITITASPDPVQFARLLIYTITVTNSGPDDATNVVVTDTPPQEQVAIELTAATSSQGSCSAPSGASLAVPPSSGLSWRGMVPVARGAQGAPGPGVRQGMWALGGRQGGTGSAHAVGGKDSREKGLCISYTLRVYQRQLWLRPPLWLLRYGAGVSWWPVSHGALCNAEDLPQRLPLGRRRVRLRWRLNRRADSRACVASASFIKDPTRGTRSSCTVTVGRRTAPSTAAAIPSLID